MKTSMKLQRRWTIALLVVMAIGTIAPFAEARGHHRRYRGYTVERRVVVRPAYRSVTVYHPAPRARYAVWRSGNGPVIAGFLGGLFLGATLATAAPHGYVYWDPYCNRGFATLDVYDAHCRGYAHEHEIDVVEAPSGYSPYHPGDGDWDNQR